MSGVGAPSASWLDLRQGHVIDVLRALPERWVSTCVTSPPYWGLRDYGIEASIWGGDPSCAHLFDLSFSTSETNYVDKRRWQHTRNGRDELQPAEKRVGWRRVGVDHGHLCRCGAWRGWLGLEPTPQLYVEHIVAVMREVRRVLRDDGTLWLNLGDCYHSGDRGGYQPSRVKAEDSLQRGNLASDFPGAPNRLPQEGLKDKDLVGIPWMVAFALRADGWWLRADIVWSKPNPMPESVTDRTTKAHEYLFLLAKSKVYAYDAEAIREADSGQDHTRRVVEPIYDVTPDGGAHSGIRTAEGRNGQGRNKRSVWEIATEPYPEAHFATFPQALVTPCVLAGCPEAGKRCDCDVVINTPLGTGEIEDDPSFRTGRAGFNRPRRENEGRRPITRREQRDYADQIRRSPHREEMARAAGEAFAHYLRRDLAGARPIPAHLLASWQENGWLQEPKSCTHPVEPSGIVLDPFLGSGTTALVANRLGRRVIGIDANPAYIEMARKRCSQVTVWEAVGG